MKAKFGGLEVSDAKRLKALEDENAKLKKLLAEAMLDISIDVPFFSAQRQMNRCDCKTVVYFFESDFGFRVHVLGDELRFAQNERARERMKRLETHELRQAPGDDANVERRLCRIAQFSKVMRSKLVDTAHDLTRSGKPVRPRSGHQVTSI